MDKAKRSLLVIDRLRAAIKCQRQFGPIGLEIRSLQPGWSKKSGRLTRSKGTGSSLGPASEFRSSPMTGVQRGSSWPSHTRVAVNLSAVQFKNRNLTNSVLSALSDSGLAPSRLELEITETVLLRDSEATLSAPNFRLVHDVRSCTDIRLSRVMLWNHNGIEQPRPSVLRTLVRPPRGRVRCPSHSNRATPDQPRTYPESAERSASAK